MDSHTFDRIEDYLAGRLNATALEQFERDLQADPGLAAEVAVYRDMAFALSPRPDAALRENLGALGKKYAPPEIPKKQKRGPWIAAIVLVALFSGWLVWKTVYRETPAPPSRKTSAPVAGQTSPQENTAPVKESPEATPPNRVSTEHPNAGNDKPALLAADFRPNPHLEALYRKPYEYRSDGFQFKVSQPAAGASLKLKNGQVDFRLSGTVQAPADQITTPFRMLLFSNKPDDYENFRFLFSAALMFEKKGALHSFRIGEPLPLKPGLYYYIIEAKDSGMLFYVGKMRVVE